MLMAQRGKEICVGSWKIRSKAGLEAVSLASSSTSFIPVSPRGKSNAQGLDGKTEPLFGPQFLLMSNRETDNPSPPEPVYGQVFTSLQRNRERERGYRQ